MAATGVAVDDDSFGDRRRPPLVMVNPRDAAAVEAVRAVEEAGDLTEIGKGAICFLTSGSSGRPKLVAFTMDALLTSARAVNDFFGLTAADVWLQVLPRFHVGGFQIEARARAVGGRWVTMEGEWNARAAVARAAEERVTVVSLVPAQVFDLVQAELPAPGSLRTVLVGGGELRPALAVAARALGWPVRASYGLTEAASTVAIQAADEPDVTRLTVLPHWQAATAADGRLLLSGRSLAHAVAQWDEEDHKYRWHPVPQPMTTNDRVHLNGRTLTFLGRADRVIKRLGELVDLAQAERGLADAALAVGVFGRVRLSPEPDDRAGHRLVLDCLARPEGEAVVAHFNAHQPPFARISEVREVPDLRLSALGKPLG